MFSGVFHLNLPKKFPKRKACIIKKNDQTSRQLVNTPERWFFRGSSFSKIPRKIQVFWNRNREKKLPRNPCCGGNWISGIKTQPKRFNSEISSSEVGTEKLCPALFVKFEQPDNLDIPGGFLKPPFCGKGRKQWPWVGSGGHGSGKQVLPQHQHDRSCDRTRLTKPSKLGSELGFFWILKIFCFWLGFEIRREFSGPYPPKDWNSTKETPGF